MIYSLNGQDLKGTSPISGWPKKRIIQMAKLYGASDKIIKWLEGMNAEDIQYIMLVPVGPCICGSSKEVEKRQKVMYYRLDTDLLKYMAGIL